MVGFLKPSLLKLLFIAEWFAFSILFLLQAENIYLWQITNLLWPLALYYLAGCGFVYRGNCSKYVTRSNLKLWLVACGLAVMDHSLKAMVVSQVSLGDVVKIIPNHLHLAHVKNTTGSWALAMLGTGLAFKPILISFSLTVLILAPFVFGFYLKNHRRSYWPTIAFVCFVAGMMSYSIDIALRGGIIDYINIPGIVTADFKDFLLSFAVAAAIVEAIENPEISSRWKGWRVEYNEVRNLIGNFLYYVVNEVFGLNR